MQAQRNYYPNSGALYKNKRQRPGKPDPDYQGNGEITCPHCKFTFRFPISAWVKEAANKALSKYLAVSFSRVRKKQSGSPQQRADSAAAAGAPPTTPR